MHACTLHTMLCFFVQGPIMRACECSCVTLLPAHARVRNVMFHHTTDYCTCVCVVCAYLLYLMATCCTCCCGVESPVLTVYRWIKRECACHCACSLANDNPETTNESDSWYKPNGLGSLIPHGTLTQIKLTNHAEAIDLERLLTGSKYLIIIQASPFSLLENRRSAPVGNRIQYRISIDTR